MWTRVPECPDGHIQSSQPVTKRVIKPALGADQDSPLSSGSPPSHVIAGENSVSPLSLQGQGRTCGSLGLRRSISHEDLPPRMSIEEAAGEARRKIVDATMDEQKPRGSVQEAASEALDEFLAALTEELREPKIRQGFHGLQKVLVRWQPTTATAVQTWRQRCLVNQHTAAVSKLLFAACSKHAAVLSETNSKQTRVDYDQFIAMLENDKVFQQSLRTETMRRFSLERD